MLPGTRYMNGVIKVLVEKDEEDEEREKDENTMKLLQAIGNIIHPSIQLRLTTHHSMMTKRCLC